MLCQQCHQREATVHIVQVFGEQMVKLNYCETCSQAAVSPPAPSLQAGWTSYSPSAAFVGRLSQLVEALGPKPRFPLDAYNLVFEAVGEAQGRGVGRGSRAMRDAPQQQVTAAQLLLTFQNIALGRFGKQALSKLAAWGIHRTEDVGEIVFELIGKGLLGKTDNDKLEDFTNGYDFREAFPED